MSQSKSSQIKKNAKLLAILFYREFLATSSYYIAFSGTKMGERELNKFLVIQKLTIRSDK